jgi:hypothetical protein
VHQLDHLLVHPIPSDLACPRCCSGASLVRLTALQRVAGYSHTHWSRKWR